MGCFKSCGHYCSKWFPRCLWLKSMDPILHGYGAMSFLFFKFLYTHSCKLCITTHATTYTSWQVMITKYRLITGISRSFFYLTHPASQYSSQCNLEKHLTANSVLVQSATFKMPFTFSIAEYADTVLYMVLMLVM